MQDETVVYDKCLVPGTDEAAGPDMRPTVIFEVEYWDDSDEPGEPPIVHRFTLPADNT
jgi:hypothetical protein